ncbi:hypothetical protein [Ferrimonas gelatinilytica]|uniref:Uncharacterized protein n=1 Tax=Ferrimonas gelatinilytica TaxID=1255257 RepID=A0ABP9S1X5_9GAMM
MLNQTLKFFGWGLILISLPLALIVQQPWLLYFLAFCGHLTVVLGFKIKLPAYGLRIRRHLRRLWLSLFWAECHRFRRQLL